MRPRAVLKHHSNSYPFEERNLDLSGTVKVGRAVAKCKPQSDNAIFDCKVLSRNHALIWFEDGKFLIRDTCSSNGTFINSTRLGPANENSPIKEIHSNDVVQFGVEIVDSVSKITHGCIIIRVKLYYPNGSEAFKDSITMFKDIPTVNMLPPYYSYSQMLEREEQIYKKLNTIEGILEEAHTFIDSTWQARQDEELLLDRLNELKNLCDDKMNYAQSLKLEVEKLNDNIKNLECKLKENSKQIEDQEIKLEEKDKEIENIRKELTISEENLKKFLDEKNSQKKSINSNICAMAPLLLIILVVLLSYALTSATFIELSWQEPQSVCTEDGSIIKNAT